MKLHRIALSIAALCAGTFTLTAHAGIERLAGASASSVNVVKALRTSCSAAGGTFALYKTNTSNATGSLGNIVTVKCSVPFDGTTNEVRINVSGGSLGAVTATLTTPVAFINPDNASCSSLGAGTETLSFIPAGEMRNCGSTGQGTLELANGGFLDVEGSVFRANGLTIPAGVDDTTDYLGSSFYQAFGVAVSSSLYQMLQSYQTYKGLLPASCATTSGSNPTTFTGTNDPTPTCQPSISRAQLAALFRAGGNTLKSAGVNGLIGGTASLANDLPSTVAIVPSPALKTKITYCRRPDTSGTQASTQIYFLSNPTATGDLGGALLVAPATNSSTYAATVNSGSSDVKSCLNAAGYAVGTLSAENNPIGGSDTFRFVKVNGNWIADGVAGGSQTAEAIAGRYDFVFQTFMFCPAGTCTPILAKINSALPAGSSSPGLYLQTESNFNKDKATAPLKQK